MKCSATTKAGGACSFSALDETGLCIGHHPERSKLLAERGRSGRRKQEAAKAAGVRDIVPLSTAAQIREYLERLAALVEKSKGGKITERVNSGVKTAMAAADLLKGELERKAQEIAELLERYPELAKRMEDLEQ